MELLPIGDMAKITGASIQALRYYDREGIVKPAYVNERTGYRYYTPGQIIAVDAVITSLELGIPLKEARAMLDDDVFDTRRFFERGMRAARERMLKAQATLRVAEQFLDFMLDDDDVREGTCSIEMEDLLVLSAPWPFQSFDLRNYEHAAAELFIYAKDLGLMPYYLYGFWRNGDAEEGGWRVFVSVCGIGEAALQPTDLPQPKEPYRFDTITGGAFDAERVTRSTSTDAHCSLFEKAGSNACATIIRECWYASQRLDAFTAELLVRK